MFAAGSAYQAVNTIASAASTASSVASGVSAADNLITNLLPEDAMERSSDERCLLTPKTLLTHNIIIALQSDTNAMNLLRPDEHEEKRSFITKMLCPCPAQLFHQIILSNAHFQNSISHSVKRPAGITGALDTFRQVTFLGASHQLGQVAWSTFIIVALMGQITDTRSNDENQSNTTLVSNIISIILQFHSQRSLNCFSSLCAGTIEKQTKFNLLDACKKYQSLFEQQQLHVASFDWNQNYRRLLGHINVLSRNIKHELAQDGQNLRYSELPNDPNRTHWEGLLKRQRVDVKKRALLMSGINLHPKLATLIDGYKHRANDKPCANIIFFIQVIYELITFLTQYNDELTEVKAYNNVDTWWLNSTLDLAWGIIAAIERYTFFNTAFSRAILSSLLTELQKFQTTHQGHSKIVLLIEPVTECLGIIMSHNHHQYGSDNHICKAFSTAFSYEVTPLAIEGLIDQLRQIIEKKSTLPDKERDFPSPCVLHFLLLSFAVKNAEMQYRAMTTVQTSDLMGKMQLALSAEAISEGVDEKKAQNSVNAINDLLQTEYKVVRTRKYNYFSYLLLFTLYRLGMASEPAPVPAPAPEHAAEPEAERAKFKPVDMGKLTTRHALTTHKLLPRSRELPITFLPPPKIIVRGEEECKSEVHDDGAHREENGIRV